MVKKIILSRYTLDCPDEVGRVKIPNGPLYDLAEVLALAAEPEKVSPWNEKWIQRVRDLYVAVIDEYDSDNAMVADLLLRIPTSGRYLNSEWCENGKGGVAACDAYEVSRVDPVPATGERRKTLYFVKFAIGKTGQRVLIVSCHL